VSPATAEQEDDRFPLSLGSAAHFEFVAERHTGKQQDYAAYAVWPLIYIFIIQVTGLLHGPGPAPGPDPGAARSLPPKPAAPGPGPGAGPGPFFLHNL
jgi:hypothetical protein